MITVSEILEERKKTHGEFINHARISQRLKFVVNDELQLANKMLDADMQESLDMICHKIARIINGNDETADHWADVAGYSTLVYNRLLKEQNEYAK